MRPTALILLALTSLSPSVRAIDGDTIALGAQRVRLVGFDAPELFHPRCASERRLARYAKLKLGSLLDRKLTFVACVGWNYGRACAILEGAAPIMIAAGLAAPYVCEGKCPKRRDWCSSGG